jgi:putative transposase
VTAPAIVKQATTGRLYPTRAQAARMARLGGQTRALWNHMLALNVERYAREKEFAFYAEMSAMLPALREEERFEGLLHRCAQMTVKNLAGALKDCGKKAKARKGFPKFKSRHDRRDAFQFAGREVAVADGRVKLPALGWVRMRGLRVPDGAKFFKATVRQALCGSGWEFALQFEAAPPVAAPSPVMAMVGADPGFEKLLTLSDGTKIPFVRERKKLLKRQRRLHRERDRRRKGSVNRRRTVARLARVHRKIANTRADRLHKTSRALVNAYAGFAWETTSLKGLARTWMAGSVSDAGLGELRRQVAYKAAWAGREFHDHPRFARSTGVCPVCDEVGPKLSLSVREWTCQGCGTVHDRDVAAAQVILLGAVGRGTPEPGLEMGRKRASAVSRGPGDPSPGSGGGPATNVAFESCHEDPSCVSTQ